MKEKDPLPAPRPAPVTEHRSIWKNLLYTFLGTTLSILLTFGSSQLIQSYRKAQDRKMSALMVIGNVEKFARSLESISVQLATRDTLATLLLNFPTDSLDNEPYNQYLPSIDIVGSFSMLTHDKTVESVFSNSIETWKNMGSFKFIDNVGKCFASMNTIEQDYNDFINGFHSIRMDILQHPDQHPGESESSKYLLSTQYRANMARLHVRSYYYRYLAHYFRYLNEMNMKLMNISEKDMLRFIDENEKTVDIDSDIPRQQTFVTPEVNPDSISDPLGWISKLM